MNKISAIEKSGGRVFGIGRTDGKSVNARFVSSSEKYIKVFDNNTKEVVKIAKTSIAFVNAGGKTIR